MIYLSTTKSTQVCLTLKEKSPDLINKYYTWKLHNKDTNELYYFSADDFSTSPYYDAFTLSVGTPESLTQSVTFDGVIGTYDYYIYQTLTEYNLDITGSTLVENGILTIIGTVSTPITVTFSNYDTQIVVGEL